MRVALVENTEATDWGQVGRALAEAGARTARFQPRVDGQLPGREFDALVVFGGEQNARDDTLCPYLPDLAGLMRRYVEAGRAVLGICLGCQILARAFGAENRIGTAREFGWRRLTLTEAGRTDPVLSAVSPGFSSFQWHSDTFSLPPGAAHLAQGPDVAQQAFRIGRAGYGTQFHFEANRAVVRDWSRLFPDAAEAMWPGWANDHEDEAARHGEAADDAGLALARAWVGTIGAGV